MFRLLFKILSSRLFKLLFRMIGSVASALLVISGYLFYLNLNSKYRSSESDMIDESEFEDGDYESDEIDEE